MHIETYKGNKNKKIILGVIALIVIGVTILITTSLAKYKVTQSIKIAEGTINYSPYDFIIDGIYYGDGTNYTETNTVPSSGYNFNSTKSYCSKGDAVLSDVILGYDMSTQTFTLTNYNQKGIKCYLYFDEAGGIEILATINGASSNTFPAKSGSYTPSSVTCTNGANAKFDYADWKIKVDTVDKTICTVNFESNKNTSFATYLKNKVCSSTPTSDSTAKDCLVNENGYRYEGSDPNNYVLFNDELWRIIGVFNVKNSAGTSQDLVKLIRDETIETLAWHSSASNSWSSATLKTALNNGYLNATDATCNVYSTTVTKTCKFSETGLKQAARNMIESVVWNLGSNEATTPDTWYTAEREGGTWKGQVGLMYPSDYGYSVLASNCARTTSVLSYHKTNCAGKNWMIDKGRGGWTMTYSTNYSGTVYFLSGSGYIASRTSYTSEEINPTIYLKSTINILGGSGTIDKPYIIK